MNALTGIRRLTAFTVSVVVTFSVLADAAFAAQAPQLAAKGLISGPAQSTPAQGTNRVTDLPSLAGLSTNQDIVQQVPHQTAIQSLSLSLSLRRPRSPHACAVATLHADKFALVRSLTPLPRRYRPRPQVVAPAKYKGPKVLGSHSLPTVATVD